MLFDLANLPYWILLGAGTLLFGFVIVSGGGDDDVDADIDTDVDLDADIDMEVDIGNTLVDFDADADADVDGGESFNPVTLLGWFGIGKAPLILLIALDLCLWGLLGWMLNVAIAPLLFIPGIDLGVFLVSLTIALFIGGQISRPIGRVFASFTEDASSDRIIGCMGRVVSASIPFEDSGKIGQVDVFDAAKNLVTVSAVVPRWAEISLRRGAEVLVIERKNNAYTVIAKDSPDQNRWLNQSPPLKILPENQLPKPIEPTDNA
ncbi:MAG: DUF1449 domain-containing protein [Cyanobacteria bacterium P01_A01_bin.123]